VQAGTEIKAMAGHEYQARIHWARGEAPFTDNRYSRGHSWRFDGGVEVPASSSPRVVRVPMSVEAAVDPEEAFVASLSSCHMLWFLSLAAGAGWRVDEYLDDAAGVMGKNTAGKTAMLRVTLHPRVSFSGERLPSRPDILRMHERAHEACFIANSVITEVHTEPQFDA
jgi:organic hydroperoxide reductase OsmC/OhrA